MEKNKKNNNQEKIIKRYVDYWEGAVKLMMNV